MFAELATFVVDKVWDWWYTWIFVMMTIESSFIPFPSELAMIPAWYLSSTWQMNFAIAFLVWTMWALLWATINYVLGRYLWASIIKSIIHKFWKYIFVSEKYYNAWEKFFKKHGSITTFNGRFIPAVRQLISIPAWVFKMNYTKFFIYTWFGAWIWNLILMTIWYIAWENKELIAEYTHIVVIWVLIMIVLVWFIYYIVDKKFTKDNLGK